MTHTLADDGRRYSLIIFDWDGTLMDSTHSIVSSIQKACADLDLPIPSDAIASWVIGLSLDQALQRVVPELSQDMLPRFIERYRVHYLLRDHELKLFEGVHGLLGTLSGAGVQTAVATGKSRLGLSRALAATGLEGHFAATRCADETHSKPNPAMLFELMDELMVPPEQVLMIGDTTHDLNMAANAGVHGLGVTYGAHPPDELKRAVHVGLVNDVAELRGWLRPRLHENRHS